MPAPTGPILPRERMPRAVVKGHYSLTSPSPFLLSLRRHFFHPRFAIHSPLPGQVSRDISLHYFRAKNFRAKTNASAGWGRLSLSIADERLTAQGSCGPGERRHRHARQTCHHRRISANDIGCIASKKIGPGQQGQVLFGSCQFACAAECSARKFGVVAGRLS